MPTTRGPEAGGGNLRDLRGARGFLGFTASERGGEGIALACAVSRLPACRLPRWLAPALGCLRLAGLPADLLACLRAATFASLPDREPRPASAAELPAVLGGGGRFPSRVRSFIPITHFLVEYLGIV